jgi:hypothetical protein
MHMLVCVSAVVNALRNADTRYIIRPTELGVLILVLNINAAQLGIAADTLPWQGPALKRLLLCGWLVSELVVT